MSNTNPTNSKPSSETTAPASPPKGKERRDAPKLPELTKLVTPHGDGWNARQYDQLANNMAIHNLLAAVAELQAVNAILIRRINNCKDC